MNYDTSLVSGMYELKDSLLFDDIISHIISREHLKRFIMSRSLYLFRNTLTEASML